MTRKLCTIQCIDHIDPIEGKDLIGLASFKNIGWQVIVRKDQIFPGQWVMYFEIDSVIPYPNTPNVLKKVLDENLIKRCYSKKYNGLIVRTIKMAGVFSQGLVLEIPKGIPHKYRDYTKKFHIKTMDEVANPEPTVIDRLFAMLRRVGLFRTKKQGTQAGSPKPSIFPTTDETRVQNLTYLFSHKYARPPFVYVTQKVDGTSASYAWHNKKFYVCSRNQTVWSGTAEQWQKLVATTTNPEQLNYYVGIANKYGLMEKLHGTDWLIQGEIAGPGIQKNTMGLAEKQLFVFNVHSLTKHAFLRWECLRNVCRSFNLQTVPFLGSMPWCWDNQDELLKFASGKYPNGHHQEGVVIRADYGQGDWMPQPDKDMSNMFSFKVVNQEYLLD
jgi:hypothetical protein